MALFDRQITDTRTDAPPPISTHPAFPAIVSAWFAALLGLGSMFLPSILLETLVSASGIAALIPMAAPPLGVTARLLIAAAAAVAGAGIGLVLARKLSGAHAADFEDEFDDEDSAPWPAEEGGEDDMADDDVIEDRGLPVAALRAIGRHQERQPEAEDTLYVAPPAGLGAPEKARETGLGAGADTHGARAQNPTDGEPPLTDLLHRLAESIRTRRETIAQAAEPAATHASDRPADLDAADADDAARAMARYFSGPADAAAPASPTGSEQPDDETDAALRAALAALRRSSAGAA